MPQPTQSGCSMSTPASRNRSSGSFEQPALEEAQVIVQLDRAAAGHAVGQGHRRRHARGVLVDVKRAVEMRNPQAFQVQLRIEREIRAEVGRQQPVVNLLEPVERERLARLGRGVGESSRTRRTSSGGRSSPRIASISRFKQERPLALVSGPLQEVVAQQRLVERAGHLGHEHANGHSRRRAARGPRSSCASSGPPRGPG